MTTEERRPSGVDISVLPPLMQRLVELIGTEKTLLLGERYGGVERLYIPHEPTQGHLWRNVLDEAEWRKVVAAMGGERVDLPRGVFVELKKVQIIELDEQGIPHQHIALRVRCSERYVRDVLGKKRKPVDDRQIKLFE